MLSSAVGLAALSLLTLAGCGRSAARLPQRTLSQATTVAPVRPPVGQAPIRKIVVDAGHGGHDPGAMRFGYKEKNLTLDIARRLRTELEGRGFTVLMTRDSDEFIQLSRRPAIAAEWDADLFVSVHINANKKRTVSGAEVYYARESVLSASAPLPPRFGPADVAEESTMVRRILWDLIMSQSRRQSVALASQVCRGLKTSLGTACRGVHGARFVVLKESRMPSILVEVGYVTNHTEATKLGTPTYRQKAAQAIADAVAAYAASLQRASAT